MAASSALECEKRKCFQLETTMNKDEDDDKKEKNEEKIKSRRRFSEGDQVQVPSTRSNTTSKSSISSISHCSCAWMRLGKQSLEQCDSTPITL